MLTGTEIKSRNFIANAVDTSFRATSYDVTVGRIISLDPDARIIREIEPGTPGSDTFLLQPQGVVEVLSREALDVPDDLTGYAMVKTGLCNQGVLALNIGIVDPGYQGPVCTTLLNFSKDAYPLHLGTAFLRLTFHRSSPTAAKAPRPTDAADLRQKVVKYSRTFLNLTEWGREYFRKAFFRYLVWASLAYALLTAALGVGTSWVGKEMLSNSVTDKVGLVNGRIDTLKAENDKTTSAFARTLAEQRQEIDRLRRQIDALTIQQNPTKYRH